MGATHFLMKTLPRVATEMALHILAYNINVQVAVETKHHLIITHEVTAARYRDYNRPCA